MGVGQNIKLYGTVYTSAPKYCQRSVSTLTLMNHFSRRLKEKMAAISRIQPGEGRNLLHCKFRGVAWLGGGAGTCRPPLDFAIPRFRCVWYDFEGKMRKLDPVTCLWLTADNNNFKKTKMCPENLFRPSKNTKSYGNVVFISQIFSSSKL